MDNQIKREELTTKTVDILIEKAQVQRLAEIMLNDFQNPDVQSLESLQDNLRIAYKYEVELKDDTLMSIRLSAVFAFTND
jgi:hypothetical protein